MAAPPAPRRLSPLQIALALVICALVVAVEVLIVRAYRASDENAASYQAASYITTSLANVQREALRLQSEAIQTLADGGPTGEAAWSRVDLRRALLSQQFYRLTNLLERAPGGTAGGEGASPSARLAPLQDIGATLTAYDALAKLPPTERAARAAEIRATLATLELQVKQLYDREEIAFFRTMSGGLKSQHQTQFALLALGGVVIVLAIVFGGSLWRSVTRDFRLAHEFLVAEASGRARADESLRLRNLELLTLHRLSEIALGSQPEQDILYRRIAEEIATAAGFPIVAIELYDSARETMVFRGTAGPGLPTLPFEVPANQTLSGTVARTGRALVERTALDRSEYANSMLRRLGVRTFVCVPMAAGERVLGTLSFAHPDEVEVDDRLSQWATSLANHLAALLERQRMSDALFESNQRLTAALDDLRRAQSTLLQQERLRALGEMASGIAHDLNNALAPVVGFAELLRFVPGALDNREKTAQYLDLIHTGAKDAAETVRRLREFYRPDDAVADLAPLALQALAEQAIALTEPRWRNEAHATGRTITVRAEVEDTAAPRILGSETHLREALTNLIFNAVDAIPRAGDVTVRVGHQPGGRGPAPAAAIIEVVDTGTGMTEDVRRRCLEPFFTTKGERGTGLGLSMVHGIVQRHGGTMEVESAAGRGTTVRLIFPALADNAAGPQAAPSHAAPPLAKRILLVDDEAPVRLTVAELLTADGHSVQAAADPHTALDALRSARFDLLITDRAMPVMSGEQVAHAAKRSDPKLPVLMLTGYGDLMNARGERSADVDVILAKPVTLSTLRSAIATLCEPSAAVATV